MDTNRYVLFMWLNQESPVNISRGCQTQHATRHSSGKPELIIDIKEELEEQHDL